MPAEPLTERAKRWHGAHLQPGGLTIDATLGNGHDALFLARRVGPSGRLFGFDRQAEAVRNSLARLAAAGAATQATLYLAGHETLLTRLPPHAVGAIDAAMFNLGYLPGGDKSQTTRPETTLAALDQVWQALRPGGRLSVIAYVGHPGGADEQAAVAGWTHRLGLHGDARQVTAGAGERSPVLYLLVR